MSSVTVDPRVLNELDFARLSKLDDSVSSTVLADIMADAEVIPPRMIPDDVVTMYSQVEVRDLKTGRQQNLTLCYPHDAEPERGFVSVLSPVGLGLLGKRTGDTARWRTPAGNECEAKVVSILFQPEATGDYTT